ncbi:uncharacterized protein LOC110014410 [Oryzias latipes]|uniref:uncharacterized protein LOC110014410 n=1 Tax=Oryzias latipes TaxID=8090 RepID=UPI000CE1FBB2|nr:uncharacterized protein LOC110014410 [Oryzias latipes]
MTPEHGYAVAKDLLQYHFGNPYRIATAYNEKALAWQTIKAEDVKALKAFSLFLRSCCNVMTELQHMQELDMPANMKAIISKLPYKMREHWRVTAHEVMERTNNRAHFIDLVAFIERHVKILSDPLFGNIQDPLSNNSHAKSFIRPKSFPKFGFKGNTVATTVTSGVFKKPSNNKEFPNCVFCAKGHLLENCKAFTIMKHKDKIQWLKERQFCFACLSTGHVSRICEQRLKCEACSQMHPTVLNIKRQPLAAEQSKESIENKPTLQTTCGHTGAGVDYCALSILPVKIKAKKGNCVIKTHAFLDPGSSATFCSEHLMQKLNVTGRRTSFLLRTMGQETVVPAYSLIGLEVSGVEDHNFYPLPEVLTQRKMPVSTESMATSEHLKKHPHLSKIHMPKINAEVDLLIGTNAPQLLEPWEVINSNGNGPYAVKTVLGWVVNGPLNGNSGVLEECPHSATVNRISVNKLEELLSSQYSYEFNEKVSKDKEMSREDVKFLNTLENSVMLIGGQYCMNLPFRNPEVHFPNNYSVAKQRLQSLKKRFIHDKAWQEEYSRYMNELFKKSYAERVPKQQIKGREGKVWYIPHHGVQHPRKKSLRVVFDCGATFKGVSLNGELMQGPNLTSSLLGVLTRFRQEPVAFMGDIQAMFHQVKVMEEHRDFLRFLWWPGGDFAKEPEEYRMTVHLFGAVSSPSCACFALQKTADDNKSEFKSEVCQTVKKNFYVDDCLKSSPTEETAVKMMKDLIFMCAKGGFILEKWISNSRAVLEAITSSQRAKDLKKLDLDCDKLPVERALGLQWCAETDVFMFKMEIKEKPLTRRGVLSVTCSIYDPLGFLAPVTLCAKMIQQELCRRKCGWDDTLPQDLRSQWKKWLEELALLSTFEVRRCIKPVGFGKIKCAQLHHFADASECGYGTVTYIRLVNQNDHIHVAILLGKARVTPLKPITIPRLELTAAVLAVRLDAMLKTELEISLESSVFWTDSTSVLNENKRFHTFVANRISSIREASEPSQWRHVCSKDNPADKASRGMKASSFLKDSVWLKGPEFLWTHECEEPTSFTEFSDDPNDLEPLTPNHLLLLMRKPALPPGIFDPQDQYVRKRWKQVQYLADLFWKRWIREYLPLLQERQKWNQRKRNLLVGDIVVIMDSSAPRGSWLLGKVLEVYSDKRGLVRSVKLQTKSNVINTPISKLCLLQEV